MGLILSAILFNFAFDAQANSCLDLKSQENVGINLALQEATGALPNVATRDLGFTVSQIKDHPQSKWDNYWYQNQPSYLTFDIVIGKPSVNTKFPYSPAVAYEVTVDTNCKVTAQLMYSIE